MFAQFFLCERNSREVKGLDANDCLIHFGRANVGARQGDTIPAMKESLADRRKRARERVASDIEEYGWHVLNVAPLEGDERQEWWSYTIGLIKTYDHPEICMFG